MFPNVTWAFVFDNVLFISAPVYELAKSCDHVSLSYVEAMHVQDRCHASVQTGKPC